MLLRVIQMHVVMPLWVLNASSSTGRTFAPFLWSLYVVGFGSWTQTPEVHFCKNSVRFAFVAHASGVLWCLRGCMYMSVCSLPQQQLQGTASPTQGFHPLKDLAFCLPAYTVSSGFIGNDYCE